MNLIVNCRVANDTKSCGAEPKTLKFSSSFERKWVSKSMQTNKKEEKNQTQKRIPQKFTFLFLCATHNLFFILNRFPTNLYVYDACENMA